ncbi:MAG: hypothetical protein DLM58_04840 [Pseudonocardiales bacterium]|nr:MAG: hypothetical protein DLM58_04840 [Pseudonocardiales bacterium]
MRIPIGVASSGNSASTLTLYAATTPGALVDLGADLGYALELPPAALVFDEHPPAGGSGMTGRDTQSALNQAIGVLIERGRTPAKRRNDCPARRRQWQAQACHRRAGLRKRGANQAGQSRLARARSMSAAVLVWLRRRRVSADGTGSLRL